MCQIPREAELHTEWKERELVKSLGRVPSDQLSAVGPRDVT